MISIQMVHSFSSGSADTAGVTTETAVNTGATTAVGTEILVWVVILVVVEDIVGQNKFNDFNGSLSMIYQNVSKLK